MILGFTLIAVALASFAFLHERENGKMTSYIRALLGYASTQNEGKQSPTAVDVDTSADAHTALTNEDVEVTGVAGKDASVEQEKQRGSTSPASEAEGSTPKVKAAANGMLPAVPSFSLQTHKEDDDEQDGSEDENDHLPPPCFPAMNSAQRAGASTLSKPPTLKPLSNGGGLMAPPPRPNPSRPVTGPLPNRGSLSTSNALSTPQTRAVKAPNPRQKVLLQPGHSPLDWANLKRSGANLAGVDGLLRVTPSQLKEKNGRKGRPAWSSYMGKVYNIGPYLPYHPGGEGELRRIAGKDGAKLFNDVHPWVSWENMLEGCLVGIMVSESEGKRELVSELDDMD
ncbi:uncharacterized protein PV09_02101 [Verruconis gallopava]|uniref:Cytochrome b5 heme-binding domain-containing protein n=1 Tax=Verruconis gallopava TaxID=253628 RepID=A0A0D2AL34_9PEZI|nr:uncharacterized protein PV09_02101 [Verruconis gallopava]KIW07245.1 hypothetical protein PV09_02101 [Verruconis gallopava]